MSALNCPERQLKICAYPGSVSERVCKSVLYVSVSMLVYSRARVRGI